MQAPHDGVEAYVSSAFRRENVALEGTPEEIRAIASSTALAGRDSQAPLMIRPHTIVLRRYSISTAVVD